MKAKGFTLVEVVVVLLILGLITVLAPPALPDFDTEGQKTVKELRRLITAARLRSVESGEPVVLAIEEDGRFEIRSTSAAFTISAGPAPVTRSSAGTVLSEGRLSLGGNLSVDPIGPWITYWFSPTGRARGPKIDVVSASGTTASIRVDWASGRPIVRQ